MAEFVLPPATCLLQKANSLANVSFSPRKAHILLTKCLKSSTPISTILLSIVLLASSTSVFSLCIPRSTLLFCDRPREWRSVDMPVSFTRVWRSLLRFTSWIVVYWRTKDFLYL